MAQVFCVSLVCETATVLQAQFPCESRAPDPARPQHGRETAAPLAPSAAPPSLRFRFPGPSPGPGPGRAFRRQRAPPAPAARAAARARRSRLPAPRLAGRRAARSAIGRGAARPSYIIRAGAGLARSPRALRTGREQDGGGSGRVRDAGRGGCAGRHPLRAAGEGTAGPPTPPPGGPEAPRISIFIFLPVGSGAGSARGRCGSKWPRPSGAALALGVGQGARPRGHSRCPVKVRDLSGRPIR